MFALMTVLFRFAIGRGNFSLKKPSINTLVPEEQTKNHLIIEGIASTFWCGKMFGLVFDLAMSHLMYDVVVDQFFLSFSRFSSRIVCMYACWSRAFACQYRDTYVRRIYFSDGSAAPNPCSRWPKKKQWRRFRMINMVSDFGAGAKDVSECVCSQLWRWCIKRSMRTTSQSWDLVFA